MMRVLISRKPRKNKQWDINEVNANCFHNTTPSMPCNSYRVFMGQHLVSAGHLGYLRGKDTHFPQVPRNIPLIPRCFLRGVRGIGTLVSQQRGAATFITNIFNRILSNICGYVAGKPVA